MRAQRFMLLCVGFALRTIVSALKPAVNKVIVAIRPLLSGSGNLVRTVSTILLGSNEGKESPLKRKASGFLSWFFADEQSQSFAASTAREIVQDVNTNARYNSGNNLLEDMILYEKMSASESISTHQFTPDRKIVVGYFDYDPFAAAASSKTVRRRPGIQRSRTISLEIGTAIKRGGGGPDNN